MDVWRDRNSIEIEATLDEMPADGELAGMEPPQADPGDTVDPLGLRLRPLDPSELDQLGLESGLFVEEVTGGPAEAAELRHGDIVLALNNRSVTTVAELREAVETAGKRFALLVQRGDGRIFVPMTLD